MAALSKFFSHSAFQSASKFEHDWPGNRSDLPPPKVVSSEGGCHRTNRPRLRNWSMTRQRVIFESQPLKEPVVLSYLKEGMCLATDIIVSCTTSCASGSDNPSLRAMPWMSFE